MESRHLLLISTAVADLNHRVGCGRRTPIVADLETCQTNSWADYDSNAVTYIVHSLDDGFHDWIPYLNYDCVFLD